MNSLNKALSDLNQKQLEAVQTLDGPVMVVAGPGTGKTQVLSLRIANILKTTDTSPSSILALTYTDSGAKSMTRRLYSLIGKSAYGLTISTFHSFAQDIITSNPDFFANYNLENPATDLDKLSIFKHILDDHSFQTLKPANSPYFYLKFLQDHIAKLKREGVTPLALKSLIETETQNTDLESLPKGKQLVAENRLKKLTELLEIYYLYQHSLQSRNLFDFDDLINYTLKSFSDYPDLLLSLQERYQYLLVDEYQDTNNAQNKILWDLTSFWGQDANLFVVGDPNQSIFRFQGASLENSLIFLDRFPKAKIITLDQSYRSTQTILDAAHSLTTSQDTDKNLLTKAVSQKLNKATDKQEIPINLISTKDALSEKHFIIQKIKSLLLQEVPINEIAIIVKNNKQAKDYQSHLKKNGISASLLGTTDLLDEPNVNAFVDLLHLIDNFAKNLDDELLFSILGSPYVNLPSEDIYTLFRYISKNRISLADYLEKGELDITLSQKDLLLSFYQKLQSWQVTSMTTNLPEVLEKILLESGFLKLLEKEPDPTVALFLIRRFLEFGNDLYQNRGLTLSEFLDEINLLKTLGVGIKVDLPLSENSVTICTAHKSKGLEWDKVFIPELSDSQWGGRTERTMIPLPEGLLKKQLNPQDSGDELRLFYVSLTRAKSELFLIFAESYIKGGRRTETLPSRFITFLPEGLLNKQVYTSTDTPQNLNTDLDSSNPILPPANHKTEDLTLSASDLNLYLDCHYKYLLEKIYKVPTPPNTILQFGTLIHKCLEYFYRHTKSDRDYPSLDDLLSFFTKELGKLTLNKKDHLIRLHQGENLLKSLYPHLVEQPVNILHLEKSFSLDSTITGIDGVTLKGKIDRIDQPNKNSNEVVVIDYKTGSSKTDGQVQGTTKDSDFHLKHQLLFYIILCDLDPTFKYKVTSTRLDFLETPHKEKKFIQRKFTATDQDLQDFKELIKKTVDNIKSQDFKKTTDLTICRRCRFQKHCYPEGLPQDQG